MVIFLILTLFIIMNSAQFAPTREFHKDYMSPQVTTAIKGIFVILIVFSHFSQYVTLEGMYDEGYVCLQNHLNQMVVSMFFFYSGYGILESYKKKGHAYIKDFPVKRFLTVFVDFAIAILLFLIMDVSIGRSYDLKTILLAFTGWTAVGNSNWYMFAIFGLYLITWISFVFLKKLNSEFAAITGCLLMTVLSIAFVYWQLTIDRPKYCYDTTILYAAGAWYSLFREKIEKFVMKDSFFFSCSCFLAACVYYLAFRKRWDSIEMYTIWAFAFTALVLLFTMKVKLGNPVLNWFGKHVFGIYILQRIPMTLLSRHAMFSNHKYIFLIFVFLSVIPMTMAFDYLTGFVNRKILEIYDSCRKPAQH